MIRPRIAILALALLSGSGCAASRYVIGMMEVEAKAPKHTHYDWETGFYFPDEGYHMENGVAVKDREVKAAK